MKLDIGFERDEGLRAKTRMGTMPISFGMRLCQHGRLCDNKGAREHAEKNVSGQDRACNSYEKTYSGIKTILSVGNYDDVVTTIGGGNMNELYYGYERKRNFIVKKLSAYNILAFPQSVAYGENLFGRLAMRKVMLNLFPTCQPYIHGKG